MQIEENQNTDNTSTTEVVDPVNMSLDEQIALASDPNTTDEVLQQIILGAADGGTEQLCRIVLQHPNANDKVLSVISKTIPQLGSEKIDFEINSIILTHQNVTENVIADMFDITISSRVVNLISGHQKTPNKILWDIFNNRLNSKNIAGLCANPSTPPTILEMLVDEVAWDVELFKVLMSNPSMSEEGFKKAYDKASPGMRLYIAKNNNAPTEVLGWLTKGSSLPVLKAVQDNPKATDPIKADIRLTIDAVEYLQKNKLSEEDLLSMIRTYHNQPCIANTIVDTQELTDAIVNELTESINMMDDVEYMYLINAISQYPNFSDKVLGKLLTYKPRLLLDNPNVTPEQIDRLWNSGSEEIKQENIIIVIASHPKTPLHIIDEICDIAHGLFLTNALLDNPKVDNDMVSKMAKRLVKEEDNLALDVILRERSISADALDAVTDHCLKTEKSFYYMVNITKQPNLSTEAIDKIVYSDSHLVNLSYMLLPHKNISKDAVMYIFQSTVADTEDNVSMQNLKIDTFANIAVDCVGNEKFPKVTAMKYLNHPYVPLRMAAAAHIVPKYDYNKTPSVNDMSSGKQIKLFPFDVEWGRYGGHWRDKILKTYGADDTDSITSTEEYFDKYKTWNFDKDQVALKLVANDDTRKYLGEELWDELIKTNGMFAHFINKSKLNVIAHARIDILNDGRVNVTELQNDIVANAGMDASQDTGRPIKRPGSGNIKNRMFGKFRRWREALQMVIHEYRNFLAPVDGNISIVGFDSQIRRGISPEKAHLIYDKFTSDESKRIKENVGTESGETFAYKFANKNNWYRKAQVTEQVEVPPELSYVFEQMTYRPEDEQRLREFVTQNFSDNSDVMDSMSNNLHDTIALLNRNNLVSFEQTEQATDNVESFDDYINNRQEAAENSSTPPEALMLLSRDKDADVRLGVAYNFNTPPKALMFLSRDEDVGVRRGAARNFNTPPKDLMFLSRDNDVDVRWGVARNSNTPPEALMFLSKDEDVYVRRGAARNSNTPPKALMSLSRDKNVYVRRIVAENSNTPPKALMFLSRDKNVDVRQRAARNSNTPPKALMFLSRDKDADVRLGAAENSNTPPKALVSFRNSDDLALRLNAHRLDVSPFRFTGAPDDKDGLVSLVESLNYTDIDDLKRQLMAQNVQLSNVQTWIDRNFDEDKTKFLDNLKTSRPLGVQDISGKNYNLFPFHVKWDYYKGYWDKNKKKNLGWSPKSEQLLLKLTATDLTRSFLGEDLWKEFLSISTHFENDVIAHARLDILDDGRINVTELQSDKVAKTKSNRLRNKLKHWDIALWKVISDYKKFLKPSDGKISIVPSKTQKKRWNETIGPKAEWIYDRYQRPERQLKEVGTESGKSPAFHFAQKHNWYITKTAQTIDPLDILFDDSNEEKVAPEQNEPELHSDPEQTINNYDDYIDGVFHGVPRDVLADTAVNLPYYKKNEDPAKFDAIVRYLIQHGDYAIRATLAESYALPEWAMNILVHDESDMVKDSLSNNTQLTSEVFEQLSVDPSEDVRCALVGSNKAEDYSYILHNMAMNEKSTRVLSVLVTSAHMPPDLLFEIFDKFDFNNIQSPEELSQVATFVALLASNQKTPDEVLNKILDLSSIVANPKMRGLASADNLLTTIILSKSVSSDTLLKLCNVVSKSNLSGTLVNSIYSSVLYKEKYTPTKEIVNLIASYLLENTDYITTHILRELLNKPSLSNELMHKLLETKHVKYGMEYGESGDKAGLSGAILSNYNASGDALHSAIESIFSENVAEMLGEETIVEYMERASQSPNIDMKDFIKICYELDNRWTINDTDFFDIALKNPFIDMKKFLSEIDANMRVKIGEEALLSNPSVPEEILNSYKGDDNYWAELLSAHRNDVGVDTVTKFPFNIAWNYYDGYWDDELNDTSYPYNAEDYYNDIDEIEEDDLRGIDYPDNVHQKMNSSFYWDPNDAQLKLELNANADTIEYLKKYDLLDEFMSIRTHFGLYTIAWARIDMFEEVINGVKHFDYNVVELQSDKVSKGSSRLRRRFKNWEIALRDVLKAYKPIMKPSRGMISVVDPKVLKYHTNDTQVKPSSFKVDLIYNKFVQNKKPLDTWMGTERGTAPVYQFANKNNWYRKAQLAIPQNIEPYFYGTKKFPYPLIESELDEEQKNDYETAVEFITNGAGNNSDLHGLITFDINTAIEYMVDHDYVYVHGESVPFNEFMAGNPSYEEIKERLSKLNCVTMTQLAHGLSAFQQYGSFEQLAEVLIQNDDVHIRSSLAIAKSTPDSVRNKLVNDPDSTVRYHLADNVLTSPVVLDILSKDPIDKIRLAVALNKRTTPRTLKNMINDTDYRVAYKAIENDNMPADAVKTAVDRAIWAIKQGDLTHNSRAASIIQSAVTKNNIDSDTLQDITDLFCSIDSGDVIPDVVIGIADRKNASNKTLKDIYELTNEMWYDEKLSNYHHYKLCLHIVRNQNASADLLDNIYGEIYDEQDVEYRHEITEALSNNKNSSSRLLDTLIRIEPAINKTDVLNHPNFPSEAISVMVNSLLSGENYWKCTNCGVWLYKEEIDSSLICPSCGGRLEAKKGDVDRTEFNEHIADVLQSRNILTNDIIKIAIHDDDMLLPYVKEMAIKDTRLKGKDLLDVAEHSDMLSNAGVSTCDLLSNPNIPDNILAQYKNDADMATRFNALNLEFKDFDYSQSGAKFPFSVAWNYYGGHWDRNKNDYYAKDLGGWDPSASQLKLELLANDDTIEYLKKYDIYDEFMSIGTHFGVFVIAWARIDILEGGLINVTELQSDKTTKSSSKLRRRLKNWEIVLQNIVSNFKPYLQPSNDVISIISAEEQEIRNSHRISPYKTKLIYDKFTRGKDPLSYDVGTEKGVVDGSEVFQFAQKRNWYIKLSTKN